MKIILSTGNATKVDHIRAITAHLPIEIQTAREAGITGQAVENGSTLEVNAAKKACFAYDEMGRNVWTMADDSGIFITALNGQPGVNSEGWKKLVASTIEATNLWVERMKNVANRAASCKTVVALVNPHGSVYTFTGEVRGYLLLAPRVPPKLDMPFSSLFVPDGGDLCEAEMSTDEENAVSHRGKAFRLVTQFLKRVLEIHA